MSAFAAPIAEQIWNDKYRFTTDTCIEDTWRRVAKELASVEKNPEEWEDKFYSVLEDFKFLPAGRIISGAGTGRYVTLVNCFVNGTIPDSLPGIFDMLKDAALTMQQGGGIGYDFSTIRPKGAPVLGVGSDASGPLSFMDVWNSMCKTIMSAGSRRGAMMATMRCDHPDIEDFITAKRDASRLRHFNLSVLVTDDFMEAVRNDEDWHLGFNNTIYRTVRARDLWNKILESTYAYAEPGVIFIDRINEQNNLWWCETISATNPCGEQPLPPYGACVLGSINLTRFVSAPFSEHAEVQWEDLQECVALATRMLDNVNDATNFPLEKQREEAQKKRRIGLGITGLADMLTMLGVRYGSGEAQSLVEDVAEFIRNVAYSTSVDIALVDKEPFPEFAGIQYSEGAFISRLPLELRTPIARDGIRNSHLTSIAPTGTISLLAGNVSSGIEPIFATSYTRKVLQPDGSHREEEVVDYAVKLYRDMFGEDADLPDYFVTTADLKPEDHVRMQAAAQKYVDSAISKTINCPEDISFEEFKDVYRLAYELGCKGCTTYRPNDITGSVLSVNDEKKDAPAAVATTGDVLRDRPQSLPGKTYKLKFPSTDAAFYVTINDDDEGNPFEMFVNTKDPSHQAWVVALTRMISAVFRRGGDVRFVAEELQAVFDPNGGTWIGGKYVPSIPAAIGAVLGQHLGGHEAVPNPHEVQEAVTQAPVAICPKCFGTEFKKESGCETCISCGHSKCG